MRVFCLALALSGFCAADTIYTLDRALNGAPPGGSAPWAVATFHDEAPNTVRLTIENRLNATEYMPIFAFNFDGVNPAVLAFHYVSGQAVINDGIRTGANAFDGGSNVKAGNFDVLFTYQTANADPNRFTGGEISVYDIVGTGVTDLSFVAPSTAGYYAAADVRGIALARGGTTSGSIGAWAPGTWTPSSETPEPPLGIAAGLLAAIGLPALYSLRCRRVKT